jgi:cation diffusion facilitator family transporter
VSRWLKGHSAIMHEHGLHPWQHTHDFGQDRKRPGEGRTVLVAVLTAAMMAVEITAGIAFGSMALLADGLHMGSHGVALGIAVFAYVYARRHAHDPRFSFGTGKVNALGGFTGAVLLALFAVMMAWESVERLLYPVPIAFNLAILVAVLGLVVNGLSVLILGHGDQAHRHAHAHADEHRVHDHGDHQHHRHHDHNLRSAYLHVVADALTSVFAIASLLTGKYLGWAWMDPLMGVVGAVMVALWSRGLLAVTSRVLLDMQASEGVCHALRESLEREEGIRVADLHVWSIGPNLYAAAVSLIADDPKPTEHYRNRLPADLSLAHVTLEVHKSAIPLSTENPRREEGRG